MKSHIKQIMHKTTDGKGKVHARDWTLKLVITYILHNEPIDKCIEGL